MDNETWRITLEWDPLNHIAVIGDRLAFKSGKAIARIYGKLTLRNPENTMEPTAIFTTESGVDIPLYVTEWTVKYD